VVDIHYKGVENL